MKKGVAILLLCVMLCSMLVGCGSSDNTSVSSESNGKQSENVEQKNESYSSESAQKNESYTSESAQKNEGNSEQLSKFGLLERDGDKDYFTPKTDDYIYQIVYTSDDNKEEEAILYSFDASGKLVQWDVRRISEYYLVNTELDDPYYIEKGARLVGDAIYYSNMEMQEYLDGWSDKYGVLYDIARQEAKYFASKPLSGEQTELKNVYAESDFAEIAGANIQMLTDDYRIVRDNDDNYYEEYIYQAFLGYDGQTPIEVPVRSYGEYNYIRTEICFYDDKGNQLEDCIVIYTFDEADMIDSYFKHSYGSYFDNASADPSDQSIREADFSDLAKDVMNNSSFCKISGRYLVFFYKESEPTQKHYCSLNDDYRSIYYSKPYLTESQIANDEYLSR